MTQPRSDVLQGTLDLMVLKTLDTLGSMHGYGIAQRIEQVSRGVFVARPGSLFAAFRRLERAGYIRTQWKTTEFNRRAKYYSLTAAGTRYLEKSEREWRRQTEAISAILQHN